MRPHGGYPVSVCPQFRSCLMRSLPVTFSMGFLALFLYARQGTPPAGQQPAADNQTIRVNVGLVQTDVMVFDGKGRFVDNLKPEQFELRVDGKVQPVSFLELVAAGSAHDEEIWAQAAGKPGISAQPPGAGGSDPGRTLLFFVDDWHLSSDSIIRSRTALSQLINTSMSPKDWVGIFPASGQLGAVRQLSNDKAALLASLEKLSFVSAGVQDLEWPPMTEAQAVLIAQRDQDVISYFLQAMLGKTVDPLTGRNPAGEEARALEVIRRRAADLAQTSAAIAERSLDALGDLLRSSAELQGRKLVFFLSDGFVLQPQVSDVVSRIRDVTDNAARAGIVIYTLDARGLVVGLPDAKTKRGADMTGSLAHSGANEVTAAQDALNALAADTGGRFLRNTNALDSAMIATLAEISRYYLLGWPLEADVLQPGNYSKIRVTVKGHPDYSVRVRQASLDLSQLIAKREKAAASPVKAQPAPPNEIELYMRARTAIDLSREELLQAYPDELRDLDFVESQKELDALLQQIGENVERYFRDFPNTICKEQVRRERLGFGGRVAESVTQNYSYSAYLSGGSWEEGRTDSGGRDVQHTTMSGSSFLTSGFASASLFFHPKHQFGCNFRYLGRQRSEPYAHVIAFAQKPGISDIVGTFTSVLRPAPARLLYQGFAWVDPRSHQIVRLHEGLLAPRNDAYLAVANSDIWYNEVRFQTVALPFWMPREVVVTLQFSGQQFRNRHRYSDYQVFSVAVEEKIAPPVVKK
jgi:VWFA-related protein